MKTIYKVMLVDDELSGLELMEKLLSPYSQEFQVCARCNSAQAVKKALLTCVPDLIFLDIQMPEEDGFALIKDLNALGCYIPFVFITAYEKYMPKAFKVQPLDYLLKPVDKVDLTETLLRFKKMQIEKKQKEHNLPYGILTDKGTEFIKSENIVYIQKEEGKSFIYLFDGNYTFSQKSLKDFLDILPSDVFCQIHKSTIVNLKYVANFCMPKLHVCTEQSCVALDIGRSYVKDLKRKLHLNIKESF